MKDSIAAIAGTLGAGAAQIAEHTTILTTDSPEQTAIGALISLVVGVVSMLLSRFLNRKLRKKK